MASQIRQNYHQESEINLNNLINLELHASYIYQSLSWYFNRDDVALEGFHKFFKERSEKEREHAEHLANYQNKRGGSILLKPIQKPEKDYWGSGLEAMQKALELEKSLHNSYIEFHKVVSDHNDAHLSDFIEEHFLESKVETIKKVAEHVTNLNRVGSGLGEYLFERESLN